MKRALWATAVLCLSAAGVAQAYPEFQRYSKERSGRSINCALCHTHSDGPEGLRAGQIGSLTQEELDTLGLARQATAPGSGLKSPILNGFGNLMLDELGRDRIQELRQRPESLAESLPAGSDLDGDGIPDGQEYLDGTHPLNSLDGQPLKLFRNNLGRHGFHIAMMVLATALGLYGLHNAILWLSTQTGKEK
ncbi:MAG: hypothetical protein MOGMAGMI_01566 [Candidatus Omnitrophica bacterium]|nr:hypothetical protein [Candidatus Omnitrophota bacterium]